MHENVGVKSGTEKQQKISRGPIMTNWNSSLTEIERRCVALRNQCRCSMHFFEHVVVCKVGALGLLYHSSGWTESSTVSQTLKGGKMSTPARGRKAQPAVVFESVVNKLAAKVSTSPRPVAGQYVFRLRPKKYHMTSCGTTVSGMPNTSSPSQPSPSSSVSWKHLTTRPLRLACQR